MNDVVVRYNGEQVSMPWEVADFLEAYRKREQAEAKQSAMVLSRGKFAFRVNRSVCEKGRSEPDLCGGHLKCVVGLSGVRQHRLVRLSIPENSEDHSRHFSADMTNHIHVV